LDNEQIIEQFDEIEQKVEKLIETCKSYKADNLKLKNRIEKMEEELREKVEAEKNYHEEKALILSKVDGLLVRLGDIAEG